MRCPRVRPCSCTCAPSCCRPWPCASGRADGHWAGSCCCDVSVADAIQRVPADLRPDIVDFEVAALDLPVSGGASTAAYHPLAGRDAVLLGEATRRLEPLDRQGLTLLGLAVVAVDLDRRVVLDGLTSVRERPRELVEGLVEALRARVALGRRRRGRARSSVTAPDPRD